MERIRPAVRPKPANTIYRRSRPAVVVWVAAFLFGAIAVGAGAKNELLRGRVIINEAHGNTAAKAVAPKSTSDLAAKYGISASSPTVARAIKSAESAPDARAVAERQAALAHGVWKPGANPTLAVMYGRVPPTMSQQQAAMLYEALPHVPQMPESITAENADRFAGVQDPSAGLPQGLSREDIQAANEQMYRGYMREKFGPVSLPPLHRDHNRPPQPLSHKSISDHQGSIREMTDSSGNIQSQFSYDPYGRASQIAGTGAVPDFNYEGYYVHQRSGLNLTATRAYSPLLGRFLNRDRIGIRGGINLYAYVRNRPTCLFDPSGTAPGDSYPSACCAAAAFGNDMRSLSNVTGNEYGGFVYQSNPGAGQPWTYTNPTQGGQYVPGIGAVTWIPPASAPNNTAIPIHSHPDIPWPGDPNQFSPPDNDSNAVCANGGFMTSPNGRANWAGPGGYPYVGSGGGPIGTPLGDTAPFQGWGPLPILGPILGPTPPGTPGLPIVH